MPILCLAAKNRRRKGTKGFPLGIPQRANVAALSLRSYLREGEQIQLLRWRFDEKSPTRKCHAPSDCKHFCPLLRARFSTNFKQKRKAKILARPLPVQTTRRRNPPSDALRQSRGRSKGERLGAFLGHFLPRSKKCHKNEQTDQRATKSRSMIVWRRRQQKNCHPTSQTAKNLNDFFY